MQDEIVGADGVKDIQKGAASGSSTMNAARETAFQARDELGDEFLGELVRTEDVVRAGDDEGQLERFPVALHQMLGGSLGSGVGVSGRKYSSFEGEIVVGGLAINLVGGNVNESLDLVDLRALEHHMRSQDVVRGKRD